MYARCAPEEGLFDHISPPELDGHREIVDGVTGWPGSPGILGTLCGHKARDAPRLDPCDQGHTRLQNRTSATLLENGLGVEENAAEAVRWYRAAADQGLASAQTCVAWMYERGVGVAQSRDEAVAFYRLAAAQDDERTLQSLERLSRAPCESDSDISTTATSS
jgi:hypothetical protein